MIKNVGSMDRIIRILVALALVGLYYMKMVDGTTALVLLGLAGVFVLTSFMSFCPLYYVFGLNSCPIQKNDA